MAHPATPPVLDRARLPAPPSSSEGAESGTPVSQLLGEE